MSRRNHAQTFPGTRCYGRGPCGFPHRLTCNLLNPTSCCIWEPGTKTLEDAEMAAFKQAGHVAWVPCSAAADRIAVMDLMSRGLLPGHRIRHMS
jgi:hypothetical protein